MLFRSRFPLALQQAVAYIREKDKELKNIRKEFKISDYLKKYEEKTKELLDFKFPEDSLIHILKQHL